MSFLDQRLWILHPDRLEGPQWRNCRLILDLPQKGQHTFVFVIPTNIKGGASGHTLFESMGFKACLDMIFCQAIQHLYPHDKYSRYWNTAGTQMSMLRYSTNSGYGSSPGRSSRLSYMLSQSECEPLVDLSNHQRLDIARRLNVLAQRQALLKRHMPLSYCLPEYIT